MGHSVRMMLTVSVLALAGFSGCGPCKCADGTRFVQELPCEECFQGCAKLGSVATSCRFDELNATETLTPIPDPAN